MTHDVGYPIQVVYSDEPLSCDFGNRLMFDASMYVPSDVVVDFTECDTLDQVLDVLFFLETENLHLVGTRGYVYHSQAMRERVEFVKQDNAIDFDIRQLTRTAGLRKAVIDIFLKNTEGANES